MDEGRLFILANELAEQYPVSSSLFMENIEKELRSNMEKFKVVEDSDGWALLNSYESEVVRFQIIQNYLVSLRGSDSTMYRFSERNSIGIQMFTKINKPYMIEDKQLSRPVGWDGDVALHEFAEDLISMISQEEVVVTNAEVSSLLSSMESCSGDIETWEFELREVLSEHHDDIWDYLQQSSSEYGYTCTKRDLFPLVALEVLNQKLKEME